MKTYNSAIILLALFTLLFSIVVVVESKSKYPHCEPCIQFLDHQIYEIEKVIAAVGTNTNCDTICSMLSNSTETNSCDYLCGIFGVKQFILITTEYEGSRSFETNPNYMCEQFKVCPVYSDKAKITGGSVTPVSGPMGTNFTFTVNYKVELFHKLGLSTMDAIVDSPGFPYGYEYSQDIIFNGMGKHEVSFTMNTIADSEYYTYAQYQVQFTLCENGCGNDKTKILGIHWVYFNITH